MSLIVNADDFGISPEVNRAIAECFEKGYIDRTTLMANMPYAKEAARISEEGGFKDKVGIHINLTQGAPLTEGIRKNPKFCDKSGEFTAAFYRNTLLRLHMDKRSMNDMYAEIKAQLDMYKSLGFTLNHVDSHHHVHTNFPVYKVLEKLSGDYKFSSVRLSRNLYRGGKAPAVIYKMFYNGLLKEICENTGDYFGSYIDAANYFGAALVYGSDDPEIITDTGVLSDEAAKNAHEFVSENNLEIMVHPMYSEDGVLVDTKIPFSTEIGMYKAMRTTI